MTDPTEKVAVEQRHRDAAADLLDKISNLLDHNGIGQVADLIRDGEYDEHEATAAFANFEASLRTETAGVERDWTMIARLAGEHGIRYRTNSALEAFLAALSASPSAESGAGDGGEEYRRMLLGLLAVIHRDGGHKTQELGLFISYQQALRISSERIAALSSSTPAAVAQSGEEG